MGLFKLRKRPPEPTLKLHDAHRHSGGPRILFVSHEATRTGAPKIILNVLRHFHEKTGATLQTILHSGGFLAEEFVQFSETDCLNLPRESSEDLSRRVRKLCTRHRDHPPQLAFCNSMESRFIAYELYRLGIPVVFLIHELPSSYEATDYQSVYDCSQKIYFPIEAVRDAANARLPVPAGKVEVLPQGLLDPAFGTRIDRPAARHKIREEMGLPRDAFLVLGCGTLDLRKGIDHFAGVARTMLGRNKLRRPVHFVWLGEGDRWTHSPYHYTMLDVEKTPARGHIHFVGERQNVEPWFVGADAFLLTSRVDPFPCVIHEAMAARLPVITFDQNGGAAAAVAEGAGLVVPFGDYATASSTLEMLASQPPLADMIRAAALQRVHNKYRFDHYANRLIMAAEGFTRTRLSKHDLDTGAGMEPLTEPIPARAA